MTPHVVTSKHTPPPNPDRFRTLVMNADGRPLSTTPLSLWGWRDTVEAVYRDRVQVLEEWDGVVVRSPSTRMTIPKVVMCNEYIQVKGTPALSRLNCALRDRFSCGYCGHRFALKELTFDHVVPRAAGGKSTWDNLLMACRKCNCLKGSDPANYNGVRGVVRRGNFVPLKRPSTPSHSDLYKIGLAFVPDELKRVFEEWLPITGSTEDPMRMSDMASNKRWDDVGYWTAELEP